MMDLTLAVPLILAIVSGAKASGMDKKYSFALSMGLGIFGFYFLGVGEVGARILEGVVAGATASGFYSGAKSLLK